MRSMRLLVLLLFLAVPAAANAQMMADASYSVFGGVAMPMAEFGDDDTADEESGYAGMGFMLGADLNLPLGDSPLGWVTSASVNSFGVDADEIAQSVGGTEGDFGRYWLVPIMTGVSYPFALSPTMSLVPMAQVGLNLAFGPNGDVNGTEISIGMSTSLAFSGGATLNVTDNIGVTARYVNGGAPEREADIEGAGDQEKDSPMTWVQFGIVYRLP